MKKLMTLTLALSFVAMSSMAFAQPEPGDVGVFADPAGTISTLDFTGGGSTTFYVVAFDMEGNPSGYEFSLNIPGDWFIQNTDWWSPEGVDATVFGDARNAQVGSGGCLDGSGAVVLAAVTVATFSSVPEDLALCIGPSSPSSFDGVAPGYNTCDSVLIPFGVAQNGGENYPNGCLILNATMAGPVATEDTSFGEVKARF